MIRLKSLARMVFFVSVIIVLVSCGISDNEIVEKAKLVVGTALKDPGSAQYRNIKITRYPKEIAKTQTPPSFWSVCGEVNSKNSFGGYAGFKRFMVRDGSTTPIYEGQLSTKSDIELFELIYELCNTSSP